MLFLRCKFARETNPQMTRIYRRGSGCCVHPTDRLLLQDECSGLESFLMVGAAAAAYAGKPSKVFLFGEEEPKNYRLRRRKDFKEKLWALVQNLSSNGHIFAIEFKKVLPFPIRTF
jgi:hypothetical protein